jgi:phenylpyruvate tautomerase PptA (4-oxalocrotonate tautomerase family)
MAHIEASFFNHRFDDEMFSEKMVKALTQAVGSVLGEHAASETSIILRGVDPAHWGYKGELQG